MARPYRLVSGCAPSRALVVPTARGASLVVANGADRQPQPLTGWSLPLGSGGRHDPRPDWVGEGARLHTALGAGDLDGDGYVDLVVAVAADAQFRVGEGGLLVHAGGPAGLDPNPRWLAGGPLGDGFAAGEVQLADLRGTGCLDLVVGALWDRDTAATWGGFPRALGGTPRVYLNDGRGGFRRADWRPEDAPEGCFALRVADVDGDGRFELVLGTSPLRAYRVGADGPERRAFWTGRLRPAFIYDLAVLPGPSGARIAASASRLVPEADSDAPVGLVLADPGRDAEALVPVPGSAGVLPAALAAGDLDGDGLVELVLGGWTWNGRPGAPVAVLRAEADGLVPGPRPPPVAEPIMAAALTLGPLVGGDRVRHEAEFLVPEGVSRPVYSVPGGALAEVIAVRCERPDGSPFPRVRWTSAVGSGAVALAPAPVGPLRVVVTWEQPSRPSLFLGDATPGRDSTVAGQYGDIEGGSRHVALES